MVYEVIGKVALYIIGTLLYGAFINYLNDYEDDWGIFFWGMACWYRSIFRINSAMKKGSNHGRV